MKKFTEEQIKKIVDDIAEKVSKSTAEILLDNIENCTKAYKELVDEEFANHLCNMMIPVSTAYQMSVFAMTNALCKLLCEDELEEVK